MVSSDRAGEQGSMSTGSNGPSPLYAYILWVLLRASGPLSVDQIARSILEAGVATSDPARLSAAVQEELMARGPTSPTPIFQHAGRDRALWKCSPGFAAYLMSRRLPLFDGAEAAGALSPANDL